MTDADWEVGYAKSLGVFLNGHAIRDPDVHGRPIVDDSFYLLFNGWDQEVDFILPPARWAWSWDVVLDTGDVRAGRGGRVPPSASGGRRDPGARPPPAGPAVGHAPDDQE